MNSLLLAVQDQIRGLPGVTSLDSLERSTTVFSQVQPADAVYLIEDGLVKLTRSNGADGRIILAIRGAGQLVGEEALSGDNQTYYAEAATITTGTLKRVPREALLAAMTSDTSVGSEMVRYILARKGELAEKVELLCLHDVEYRILHYLAHLSTLLRATADGSGFHIPITQLELADLIGATRETTSTTLNQLERRGLIKLSRRLLNVPNPDDLRRATALRSNPPPAPTSQGVASSAAV